MLFFLKRSGYYIEVLGLTERSISRKYLYNGVSVSEFAIKLLPLNFKSINSLFTYICNCSAVGGKGILQLQDIQTELGQTGLGNSVDPEVIKAYILCNSPTSYKTCQKVETNRLVQILGHTGGSRMISDGV